MKRTEYFESLKDPRWQRKRLEIFQRDGFACCFCGDTETTLHVHHLAYWPGIEPWEYPEDWLRTVCAPCHEERTALDREKRQASGPFHRQVFAFLSETDPETCLNLLQAIQSVADRKALPFGLMVAYLVLLCARDRKTHRLSDWIKEVDDSHGWGDR